MIRNLFLHNLRLKLLALSLAVVLWLVVVLEQGGERDFSVRVVYTLPPGSVIKNASPPTVTARIAGPRIMLVQASMKGVEARLDLRGTVPGRVVFTNIERMVPLPRDLRVVRIQPAAIEVVVAPGEGEGAVAR